MKSILVLALICLSVHSSKVLQLPQVDPNSYKEQLYQTKLDHFSSEDSRTFNLRYWINYDHWSEDSDVVLLYVCGESACYAPSSSQFPQQVGASLGALLLSLEHRYYGASQPFSNEEGGWSTENLQYLTSQQALADIAGFIDYVNADLQAQGRTQKQRWVLVGGSYPGAVVAWFKSQYPQHAFISWSSSGVIHAIEDYTDYDLDLYEATSKSGEACPETIQKITAYMDRVIRDSWQGKSLDEYALIKTIFKAEEAADSQLMSFIADTVAGKVQYGQRSSLCEYMMEMAEDDIETQLEKFHEYTGDFQTEYYDVEYLKDTTVKVFDSMRQWMYQVCHEFGWFQTPNPDHAMRSPLIKEPFWLYQCSVMFDGPTRPDVAATNDFYGGLDIQGDHIIFANAAEDPWKYAAMRTIHDPTTQSGMKAVYIDCDDCAHCVDLGSPKDTDSEALTQAREEIYEQILLWLDEDEAQQLIVQ